MFRGVRGALTFGGCDPKICGLFFLCECTSTCIVYCLCSHKHAVGDFSYLYSNYCNVRVQYIECWRSVWNSME